MEFATAEHIYSQFNHSRSGLPAWAYQNAAFTQLEMEQVFLCHWFWFGHVSEIANPGDYRCRALATENALVIRGSDGEIRAFHNLCQHRGSRVVASERGNCQSAIVCPFHGWSYHLDGQLKQIPRARSFPEMDFSQYALKPLACEIWHGLIFIRFAGTGPSVAELLAEAEAEVSLYRLDAMKPIEEFWHLDFDLDWKSVVDVDNEGYHVPMGHPGLHDLFGSSYQDQVLKSGLGRAHGYFKEQVAKTPLIRNYIDSLPTDSYLPKSHQHCWIYWSLFPGLVITLFPDMVEIYQTYPLEFQKSTMAGRCFALNDEATAMQRARALNREINAEITTEDVQLVSWIDSGMRSQAYTQALLSDLELGVASFQNQLRAVLPVVTLDTPPEAHLMEQQNTALRKACRAPEIAT